MRNKNTLRNTYYALRIFYTLALKISPRSFSRFAHFMLNSTVTHLTAQVCMLRPSIVFLVFFVFFVTFVDAALWPAAAQDESPTPAALTPAGTPSSIPELPTVGPISILYPLHGQPLKATVKITGSIALEGWTTYELAFADAASAEPNWFVFATGSNPVIDGLLAEWDTTSISDGVYNLRLRVTGPNGEQDVFVEGVRINNYTADTPEPTSTPPASATPTSTPMPTVTLTFTPLPTETPYSTPTRLPPNPASLRPDDIAFNLGRGALFAAVLFGVFGWMLKLRRR